jgi:hypothetical protein
MGSKKKIHDPLPNSKWNALIPKSINDCLKKTNPPILFIGSGFGKEAVPPLRTADGLSALLRNELKIKENGENLSELLQYLENSNVESRKTVISWLKKNLLHGKSKPGGAYYLLLQLPFHEFLTTNYDHLLADAALTLGYALEPIDDSHSYKVNAKDYKNRTNAGVLGRLHGGFGNERNIVSTTDDYIERFISGGNGWADLLKDFLKERTIIFIGYSLRDFTTWTTLISVLADYKKNIYPHYLVSPIDTPHYTEFWKHYGLIHIPLRAHQFLIGLHDRMGTLQSREDVAIAAAAAYSKKAYTEVIPFIEEKQAAWNYSTRLDAALRIVKEAEDADKS